MKRNDFKTGYISTKEKVEYFNRLTKSYTKNHEKHYFIMQYLDGDGNELKKKFWSIKSSSRFAFELYSWLAKEKDVVDFQFEKKLKTINGSKRPPNMDVYIEKKDEAIFIESKLTEKTSSNIDGLSESYYEYKTIRSKQHLYERFYKDKRAAKEFRKFILWVKDKLLINEKNVSWMDYKQEITHLIGIYLTIKDNQRKYKNKKIRFLNVFYDFKDEINKTITDFFSKANKTMNRLLDGLCVSFSYWFMSAQDLIKPENKDIIGFDSSKKAYGTNKTVGELLNKYFKL